MKIHSLRGIAGLVNTLWKDTSGVILPYVTGLLVAVVGLSLLAIDGARLVSSQTQMQSGADALALAGAAELDRQPDSITRATNAINGVLNNLINTSCVDCPNKLFAMGVTPEMQPGGIIFYQALPAGSQALSAGTVTTNPLLARFVAVRLIPKIVQTIFPVSFLKPGGTNAFSTGATAVAGRDTITCRQTPMWVCNPFEQDGDDYATATRRMVYPRPSKFMQLQLAPNNAQYSPGNFGWVRPSFDTSGGCGAGQPTTQTVSRSRPQQCFAVSGMDTQPGNIANANDGINTRFDLYSASFNSCQNNSLYGPASDVRKGWTPGPGGQGACNPDQQPILPGGQVPPVPFGNYRAIGFPLDNNMIANGVQVPTQVTGDGTWACGDFQRGDSNSLQTSSPVITTTGGGGNAVTTATYTFAPPTLPTGSIWQGMAVSSPGAGGGGLPLGATTATTAFVSGVTSTTVVVTLPSGSTYAPSQGDVLTFNGYWNTAHPPTTTGYVQPSDYSTNGNGTAPPYCFADPTGVNLKGRSPNWVDPDPTISVPTPAISRDSVAQWELGQNPLSRNYTSNASRGGEVGGPTCSSTPGDPDRSYIDVAVANCKYLIAHGIPLNGQVDDMPVASVGQFRLVLPVTAAASPIYAEFKKLRDPTISGDNLRYRIQLYR